MIWRETRLPAQCAPNLRAMMRSAKLRRVGVLLSLGAAVFLGAVFLGKIYFSRDLPEESAPAANALGSSETPAALKARAAAPAQTPRVLVRRKLAERELPEGGLEETAESPSERNGFTTRAGKFSRADTVSGVLSAHGLGRSEIQDIVASVPEKRVFSRIRAGRRYVVRKQDGEFREFVFHLDNERRLRVSRTPAGTLKATKEAIPYLVDVVRMQSRVNDSLHQAIADAGGSPGLVNKLSDIFAYVIDFDKDLQNGDQVEALIERRRLEGEFVGYGRVLAAEFVVRGKRHTAVYFDHKGGRYYTFEGKSLARAFLRSPLRYTRVSSRFSRRRFHPVLKRYRPHFGVDYAAPRGTPVRAVADGVVTWKGRKNQAGKMVRLSHDGGYATAYLHLSRYARGIRRGRRVLQRQVIGYVGSTGLSTGPHLDYRITHRGRHLDPLKMKLPQGVSLPGSLRPAFKKILDARRAMFDNLPLLKDSQVSVAAHERLAESMAGRGRASWN